MSEGMVVTAHDPVTGHQAWQLRQEGVGGEALAGSRVAVTDSRAFVAGQRRGSNDLVVLAVDAGTGRTSWLAEDAGAPADRARPVAVVATPGVERVFVTAISWRDQAYVQWVTIAYDGASGKQLWVSRHRTDDSAAQPNGMVLRPGGDLLHVTGWSKQQVTLGASFGFFTIAYDTSDGTPVWTGGSSAASGADELAWSIDTAPDGGRVYVAGYAGGATAGYRVEARQAGTGEVLWSSSVPLLRPTQDDEGLFGLARVRSSADGREVYVAMSGHDEAPAAGDDPCYAVAAFDAATGRFLWRGTHAEAGTGGSRQLEDLDVDPAGGRVYVTGHGGDPGAVETAAFVVSARRSRT